MDIICKHFDDPCDDESSFEAFVLLRDLTQRKLFLDNVNRQFKRLCSHVVELSGRLQRKEKSYLDQIETLNAQNSALFEENAELIKKQQASDLEKDLPSFI